MRKSTAQTAGVGNEASVGVKRSRKKEIPSQKGFPAFAESQIAHGASPQGNERRLPPWLVAIRRMIQ